MRIPDVVQCSSAPPSSSADTSSPVAALTRGGPPRKMVPLLRTMTLSSAMAGTYAPPAVHEPMTTAIWVMPAADMRACAMHVGQERRSDTYLVVKDAPKVVGIWKHVGLSRKVGTAAVDHVHAWQVALHGNFLQPQVLL